MPWALAYNRAVQRAGADTSDTSAPVRRHRSAEPVSNFSPDRAATARTLLDFDRGIPQRLSIDSLGALATENEALLVRVNELEGEVALLEERVDNLKNRKALLEERVDNLKNRKALLEERVDNLQNRKALLEERVDNLQNRKALLEERVDNLKNRKALRAANWVGATRRRLSRK